MRLELARSLAVTATLFMVGCDVGAPLAPADVRGLADEFDGDTLAPDWKVLNGETAKIWLSDGQLRMQPTRNVVWYHADKGPLVHKTVTGNFRMTTTARTRKASDPTQPPDTGFQFGGLMARAPGSDAPGAKQDYVFNVVGYRGEHLSVETKTTKQDHSIVVGPPWPSPDAELRICRVNGRFFMYKRPIGGTEWKEASHVKRPDLPATLQIGFIAYSYTDAYDLQASFEKITLSPVSSAADCEKDGV